MTKLINSTPDDLNSFAGLSFSELFPSEFKKANHSLIGEIRKMASGETQQATPKAIKCFKGLQSNDLASALFSIGLKNVGYSRRTEFIDAGEVDLKCRVDLVDEQKKVGAFMVVTSATNQEEFSRACIKNNHWTRASFYILASDLGACFIIGISISKPGRIFVSGFPMANPRYTEGFSKIRKAISEGYSKETIGVGNQ